MKKNRIIAVLRGGDWTDASVNHLILLKDVDLDKERGRREEWYDKEYVPQLRRGKYPKYYTFSEWLVNEGLARDTTDDEVLEFLE